MKGELNCQGQQIMENTEFISNRECLSCSKPLRGRIDKKFCNDYCRNVHNNKLRAGKAHTQLVRNINNILLKNRRIMDSLLPGSEEKMAVSKDRLISLGFQFRHMTHTYTNKSGKTYFYCYDYGFLPLENDWYLLVKDRQT